MEKKNDFRNFQSTDCSYLKSAATGKFLESDNPAGIYLLKVDNGNTRTMYDICLIVTTKTPERRQLKSFWCFYCYLWIDFTHCYGVSILDFEQVNTGWEFPNLTIKQAVKYNHSLDFQKIPGCCSWKSSLLVKLENLDQEQFWKKNIFQKLLVNYLFKIHESFLPL